MFCSVYVFRLVFTFSWVFKVLVCEIKAKGFEAAEQTEDNHHTVHSSETVTLSFLYRYDTFLKGHMQSFDDFCRMEKFLSKPPGAHTSNERRSQKITLIHYFLFVFVFVGYRPVSERFRVRMKKCSLDF